MEQICHISELPKSGSKGFTINKLVFFAVHDRNDLHLYVNRCPHLGTTLEFMPDRFLSHDRRHILCSTHGALFEIKSGRCIHGPCQGDYLQKLDYRIIDDYVWANISEIA